MKSVTIYINIQYQQIFVDLYIIKQNSIFLQRIMMDDYSSSAIVTFSKKCSVGFGKALYIVGNTFDLGEWKIQQAKKLEYNQGDNWIRSIRFPINSKLQYKFFISDYQLPDKTKIQWEQIVGNNMFTVLQHPKPPLPISICSFNIRFLNNQDKGNIHWDARKNRIIQYARKKNYDFIGLQQATKPQRQYLAEYMKSSGQLKDGYQYYGKARDLHTGEQCGIFVKQTYTVIEDHYDWISQTRKQGSVGYDAKLPRYFTSVLVTPKIIQSTYKRLPCFLVINAHLDHMGKLARKKGIQHIHQKCLQIQKNHIQSQKIQLMGCIVMGDFNASETDSIFDKLTKTQRMKFKSMRDIPNADKSFTFNGFSNKYLLKIGQLIINDKLTIDHMYYWFKKNSPYYPLDFIVDKPESEAEILSDHYPIIGIIGRNGNTPS